MDELFLNGNMSDFDKTATIIDIINAHKEHIDFAKNVALQIAHLICPGYLMFIWDNGNLHIMPDPGDKNIVIVTPDELLSAVLICLNRVGYCIDYPTPPSDTYTISESNKKAKIHLFFTKGDNKNASENK